MADNPIVVGLYAVSPQFLLPWREAGCEVYIVDIEHPPGLNPHGLLSDVWTIGADLRTPFSLPEGVATPSFVAAFPPCDHLAVSGNRWKKGKGLRALEKSIAMFATAAEFCEESGARYLIENPVSSISTYWRKPDFTFQPFEYTLFERSDNYTKRTCLWTGGGFVMPPRAQDTSLGEPDNRVHAAPPGPNRAAFRNQTPRGFARAVYEANSFCILK
jgi:hypothetical protein